MTDFSIKWDTEIKQLANNCVDWEFIKLVQKGENNTLTSDEEAKVQEFNNKIRDVYGMWYISDMIWRVEHALADQREYAAKLALAEIYGVISTESYWTNLFNNDLSIEEAKNIKLLERGLASIM